MFNIQTTSNNAVNNKDKQALPQGEAYCSQLIKGLMKVGENFQESAILQQKAGILDSENNWELTKDAYEHKGKAADSALKASKIEAGVGIASGIATLGLSFGGSIASKGIGSKERSERKDVMGTADNITDPYEREAYLSKNRDVVEPHRKLELMGRNASQVGTLLDSVGKAASSGVSAEVSRENNAADLDKTMSGIAAADQKTSSDAAKRSIDGLRSLTQMLATMQGKASDARAIR